ncbi:MAG: MCP four helix bundle domain-containing protein, partial [Oscillospiraceae bacterium]|nr:MCP four helix bundle domain-containing protein [Oscillospiraceae bacterium]
MFKNMKISTRLITAFTIVVALLIVTGVTSLIMISNVGNSLQQFHDNNYLTVTNVWSARYNLFAMRASILRSLIDEDQAVIDECLVNAQNYHAAAVESTAKLKDTYLGDLSQIDSAVSKLNALTTDLEKVRTYAKAGNTEAGYDLYN